MVTREPAEAYAIECRQWSHRFVQCFGYGVTTFGQGKTSIVLKTLIYGIPDLVSRCGWSTWSRRLEQRARTFRRNQIKRSIIGLQLDVETTALGFLRFT